MSICIFYNLFKEPRYQAFLDMIGMRADNVAIWSAAYLVVARQGKAGERTINCFRVKMFYMLSFQAPPELSEYLDICVGWECGLFRDRFGEFVRVNQATENYHLSGVGNSVLISCPAIGVFGMMFRMR